MDSLQEQRAITGVAVACLACAWHHLWRTEQVCESWIWWVNHIWRRCSPQTSLYSLWWHHSSRSCVRTQDPWWDDRKDSGICGPNALVHSACPGQAVFDPTSDRARILCSCRECLPLWLGGTSGRAHRRPWKKRTGYRCSTRKLGRDRAGRNQAACSAGDDPANVAAGHWRGSAHTGATASTWEAPRRYPAGSQGL